MQWTAEALRDMGREDWNDVFRFCALELDTLYELPLFDGAVWRRIGSRDPVGLF